MSDLHVLRVFVDADGAAGNPLGVVREGVAVAEERRLEVAAELGFSETVFVDDAASGVVRIYTPRRELPFAGHPLVGAAWLLFRVGVPIGTLRPPVGEVPVWRDDHDRVWIRGRAEWAPDFRVEELDDAAAVEALRGPPGEVGLYYGWAWEDEGAGRVRARMFAPELGVSEDEATGSAAVRLGATLGRRLVIRQGVGSVLVVSPGPGGSVDVGGHVVLDEVRELG